MILAIMQARLTSTRLPGKVMLPILGKPMFLRQVERVQRARRIDRLVVATSIAESDEPLVAACAESGVECYRGSLNDVLDRYASVAARFKPDGVVRLTADCPLADHTVIDRVIARFEQGQYDYVCNSTPRTFPQGLDVSIMSARALEESARDATLPADREHVVTYVRAHPERFRLDNVVDAVDRADLRWTVDLPADYAFVCEVYERLYPRDPSFSTDDILSLLESDPRLKAMCSGASLGQRSRLVSDRLAQQGG